MGAMRPVAASLLVLAACGGGGNPDVLYLAPAANGFDVALSDREPFQY